MRYVKKQTAAQNNQLSLSTKFPAHGARAIFALLLAACTLLIHTTAFAVTLSKQVDEFSRYYLINPTACIPPSVNVIENIRTYRNLGAVTSCSGFNPVRGWFEYDFNIPATGWYKLDVGPHSIYEIYIDSQFVDPNNYTNPNGPDFDPTKYDTYLGGLYYGNYGINSSVGNVWLTRGTHRVRLQNYLWTGFPATTSVSLISAPDQALAKNVRAAWKALTSNAQPVTRTIHRVNQCQPLEIFWGGARTNTSYLNIFVKERFTGAPIKSDTVRISSTSGQKKTTYNVPCSQEGYYTVSFGENGTPINTDDVLSLNYEVINTANQPWSGGEVNKTQVGAEIDCANVNPDYQSTDDSKRITQPFGIYRESGTRSWRDGTPSGADASWYAYTLPNLTLQTPHIVEVDYPDDALRTFVIALRESKPLNYSVAGGVDSGGEFSLSNKMLTHSLLFWPRASDPRLVFVNVREGRRGAACSKIRVYRVDGNLPELLPAKTTGRRFVNWYEEGRNFIGMYNPDYPDMYHDPRVFRDAADRWTEALAYMGGDTLSPSAAVYEGDIYPSRYNLALAPPSADDILRRIFLVAEKRGMKVLPELHPRGDAASWPYVNKPDPKRNLLVFKDGTTPRLNGAVNGPYNPIYPANQNWYLAMIGELIDRYKDSPALLGVNLRTMKWADSIYNNFHSLDYGYDDYTVNLFNQETSSNIALGSPTDPGRFMQRYTALTSGANRDKWIAWRSKKIADLYTAIRDRVRQARPDLKVYTTIFEYFNEPTLLKEAGIDVDKLKQIDGVVVVNAMRGYGRDPNILNIDEDSYKFPYDTHGPNGDVAFQKHRDSVLDPVAMNATASATTSASFLDSANYFEHGAIPPPTALGFPQTTPATVVSAVVNPAGRHYLERYAVQLAETDTAWMGDGGNAYTIGQPLLREFMQEYRRLPVARFTKRNDATEPVAIWELTQGADYYFYAVNRERYPVTVKIQLNGQITSLVSDQPISTINNLLTLTMKPYELRAFKGSAGIAISSITQTIPAADLQLVTDQVVFLETNPWVANLGDAEALAIWNAKKQQARAELDAGHYWRARLIVESYELLQIYNRIGYPPRLRDNGSATAGSATVFEDFEAWPLGTVPSGFPTVINGWSIRGGSDYSIANMGSPQNQVIVLSPGGPNTWHTAGKPHQVSVTNGAIEISGQIALNARSNPAGQIWLSDSLQNGYGIFTNIVGDGDNKASIVKFRDSTVPFAPSPGSPTANWAVALGEHYDQPVKVGGGFASDFIGFIEFHLRLEQSAPGMPVTLTLWFTGSNLADTSYANPAQRLVDDGGGTVFNNGAGGYGPVLDLTNLTYLAFTGQAFNVPGQISLPLVRWNNLNVTVP